MGKRKCYRTILTPGQKFGSWTVIGKDEEETKKRKYTMYFCKCDCNDQIIYSIRASRLTNGYTTNCKNCGDKKMSKTKRGKNQYNLTGEYGKGWTTNTNKEFYFDLEDYDKIKEYTWYENTHTGYVTTQSYNKCFDLHRFIMNPSKDEIVDHIHGVDTKMDNRKCNLRLVNKSQNNMNVGLRSNNKSGVTGVHWKENANKWEARIGYNGETICLGRFESFEDAVTARKKAENKYYGEYSYDNSQNIHEGGY